MKMDTSQSKYFDMNKVLLIKIHYKVFKFLIKFLEKELMNQNYHLFLPFASSYSEYFFK